MSAAEDVDRSDEDHAEDDEPVDPTYHTPQWWWG